jgi:hypothetical protein
MHGLIKRGLEKRIPEMKYYVIRRNTGKTVT